MANNVKNQLSCRICSTIDCVMTTIFEEHEYESNVCEMLEICGGLVVERNDGFSNLLCETCSAELLVAYNFRKKCIKVQNKMKQNLEGEAQVSICSNVDNDSSEEELNIEELLKLLTETKDSNQHPDGEPEEEEEANSNINFLARNEFSNDIQNDLVELELSSISTFQENGLELKNNNDDNVTGFDVNNCIEFDADNIIEEEVENTEEHEQQNLEYENDENDNPIDIIPTEYTAIEYNCDVCGAYFMQSTALLRHLLNQHHSNKYYSCKNCKHCFANADNYQAHTATCQFDAAQFAIDEKIKNCTCTYCGKKFNGAYALEVHERTHTGEKPFPCTFCEKSFRSTAALANHEKRHNGESPKFNCHVCEKSFSEKCNLRVHMRSHTGVKVHKCTVCGKKFSRIFTLTLHRRTHTGEQPYPCEKCSRAFKQKCDLQKHMQIHVGNRQYSCSWCGQGFMHRSRLDRHVKDHENKAKESCNISRIKNDKLGEIVSELELDKFSVCD